jgi:hypothetical protein
VALPALDAAAPLQQAYQNNARFAVALRAAEPRQLEILAGVIAWYRDRPEGKYTLTDSAGVEVREGRLKLDGETHPVSLAVPKDGTYYLEIETSAGWKFKTEPGLPMVLLNEHGRQHTPLGQVQPLFFYVPRGTKELQYFWTGGPHKVRGPRGEVMRDVAVRDEVVTIPVPAGADGACWSFSNHSHARLYFYNAPNVLAASPATILLPREVVERDGLAPR